MELTNITTIKSRVEETKVKKSVAHMAQFQSSEEIALFLNPMVIALQSSLKN